MTPHEERLVLELHSKWGNRWSRIARKLPGRTDNEIKNYWRTHMRKKAQERKKSTAMSPSSSSSNSSSSSSTSITSNTTAKTKDRSFYDTGGIDMVVPGFGEKKTRLEIEETNKVYSLDEIWKDIDMSQENCNLTTQTMVSPLWDFCPPSTIDESMMWSMDQDQSNFTSSFPFYNHHMIG